LVSADAVSFAERKALEDELVEGDDDDDEDDARYLNLEGEDDGNLVRSLLLKTVDAGFQMMSGTRIPHTLISWRRRLVLIFS